MFCKTCLSHHCASITPSSSSTESTAIQRRRKKNKEEKKTNTTLFKNWFLFEKKKSCATVDGHSAQFLPYDSQLQLIFIKAFTDTQKKNCPSQNGRRWHWCFLQSDRLASASTCSSKTEILCQHYAKDRWTNEATIMYSVTDQQKTKEFDSQMKKNQVKTLRQRSLDKWSNIMYIMYSVTDQLNRIYPHYPKWKNQG